MPSRKNSFANNIEQLCDLKAFVHLASEGYRDTVRIWSDKRSGEKHRTRAFNLILCAVLYSVID